MMNKLKLLLLAMLLISGMANADINRVQCYRAAQFGLVSIAGLSGAAIGSGLIYSGFASDKAEVTIPLTVGGAALMVVTGLGVITCIFKPRIPWRG